MPDLSKKFTDHKLKQLFGHVLNHYKNCAERQLDVYTMRQEMFAAVQYAIESPWSQSPMASLDRAEKEKAYAAFDKIFYALPIYRNMPAQDRRAFNPPIPQFNPKIKYVINEYNYYDCHDSTLMNWLILSSIIDSHNHLHNHHSAGGCCFPSNHHGHDACSSDDMTKLIAALIVIALALIAAVVAFIALYYMLSEFANGVERFCYGEGWLKGALMFATSIAFGAGSASLTLNFAAAPLIALAVAAGFNPVGVVIMGAVLLSVIGAGIGCFAMGMLYDSINKSANKESMDPSDPDRFNLTAAEEERLRNKNIDPIAVKCAMVALRAEMAKFLGNEKPIPSFFSRHFNNGGDNVQELLVKLRHLRKGDLTIVEVGDLYFDCRVPQPVFASTYYQPTPPPSYYSGEGVDTSYGLTPSAPSQF